jgi:hypothetical protein
MCAIAHICNLNLSSHLYVSCLCSTEKHIIFFSCRDTIAYACVIFFKESSITFIHLFNKKGLVKETQKKLKVDQVDTLQRKILAVID